MEIEVASSAGTSAIAFVFDRRLDRKQVARMAEAVEREIAAGRDLRLLLDLRRTETFAAGAFVSPHGFLASIRSVGPVSRYAVVGAPALAALAVEAFGTILPLEARAFDSGEIGEARRWVGVPPGPPG